MAGNGGIIGPVNSVSAAVCLSAKTTSITATGTFTVQCAPAGGTRTGDLLVVAGGGSSSAGCRTGGGGAGGFRLLSCQTFPTCGIPVTIGAGGSSTPTPGKDGYNTVFGSSSPITSCGGGGGGGWSNDGNDGGSGGGGGGGVGGHGCGGTGVACQGYPGGEGKNIPGGGGAGGGGASAAGAAAGPIGAGGAGLPAAPVFGSAPQPFYLSNVSCTGPTACGHFAGGGAGGGCAPPSTTRCGGIGGGGKGFTSAGGNAVNGRINSGGGGGGNYNTPACYGKGGSGIVLVKEDAVSIPAKAPGIWSMNTVYEYVKDNNWA